MVKMMKIMMTIIMMNSDDDDISERDISLLKFSSSILHVSVLVCTKVFGNSLQPILVNSHLADLLPLSSFPAPNLLPFIVFQVLGKVYML